MNQFSILSKLFILLFVGITTLATRYQEEQVAQQETAHTSSQSHSEEVRAN